MNLYGQNVQWRRRRLLLLVSFAANATKTMNHFLELTQNEQSSQSVHQTRWNIQSWNKYSLQTPSYKMICSSDWRMWLHTSENPCFSMRHLSSNEFHDYSATKPAGKIRPCACSFSFSHYLHFSLFLSNPFSHFASHNKHLLMPASNLWFLFPIHLSAALCPLSTPLPISSSIHH